MIAIFKANKIDGIGGVMPQGSNIELLGEIGGWTVLRLDETDFSKFKEFGLIPVDDKIAEGIEAPETEGVYYAQDDNDEGDDMRILNNPGQLIVDSGYDDLPDGTPMGSPDDADDRSQKTFSSEDVAPYKEAVALINDISRKEDIRAIIESTVKDPLDDIADAKYLTQIALSVMTTKWSKKSEGEKNKVAIRNVIDSVTDTLKDTRYDSRIAIDGNPEKVLNYFNDEIKIMDIVKSN